jgi:hypothetical protein
MGQYQDKMVFDFHLVFSFFLLADSTKDWYRGGYSRLVKLNHQMETVSETG